jgi:hypothetical protein
MRIPIDFLIVTDSRKREYSYQKAIERMINTPAYIQEMLIRMHLRILRDNLGLEPEKIKDLPAKIKAKYFAAKEFVADDLTGIPVEELQKNGLMAVSKLTEEVLCIDCSMEERLYNITELFRKLYRLTASGKLKMSLPYSIHTYQIGYKYSVN